MPLDHEELEAIQSVRTGGRHVRAGEVILDHETDGEECMTLFSGWAMRQRALKSGKVQITSFLMAGSFIDAGFELANGDGYSIEAITDVELCLFSAADLKKRFGANAVLSRALATLAQSEEALLFEHMTDIGRRSAMERLAHFLLETYTRQKMLGMAGNDYCPFPLRQHHLADAMGLSFEHVNRMLRELKEKGWVAISGGRLYIMDFASLGRYCDFDDSYLRPRPIF